MTDIRTPGVYVRFDESRQQRLNAIPSAVPAFIGYTENKKIDKEKAYSVVQFQVKVKSEQGGDEWTVHEIITHKVKSLRDFTSIFGNQQNFAFSNVYYDEYDSKKIDRVELEDRFFLYDSVKLFYENGGGECFVVSIGHTPYHKSEAVFSDEDDNIERPDVTTDRFLNGLRVAAGIPEVTLLLMPDLQVVSEKADLNLPVIYDAALKQCFSLKDRMVIFDVSMDLIDRGGGIIDPEAKLYEVDINPFRTAFSSIRVSFRENNPLMYGAAYYPWLYTNFFYEVNLGMVDIPGVKGEDESRPLQKITTMAKSRSCSKKEHRLLDQLTKDVHACHRMIVRGKPNRGDAAFRDREGDFTRIGLRVNSTQAEDVESLSKAIEKVKFDIKEAAKEVEAISDLQSAVLMALRRVPPSGAIAGLIAKTDREEGVWKAPANTPLEGVLGPVLRIDPGLQQDMNVHGTGLSVNSIRSSIGRGTIVWGARTMDSNNRDWRYIPVRRLFIYVEQSVKRRLRDFVFEDNDRDTWIQIKLLIEDFLISIWRNGGLNGQTPAEAFFVKVGLGETMTQLDMLEGRMIIEIGLAAVRPLEFIRLIFTAKLEEGII